METEQSLSIKDLTASEAYVLLHGPSGLFGSSGEVFEKSILELVGGGWLRTRESPEALGAYPGVRFILGKRADVPKDRPLFAAFSLFFESFSNGWAPDDGLPGFALWRALSTRYGKPSNYANMEVMPSLHARGLYERAGSGLVGTLLRGGWQRTRAGDQLSAEIQDSLSEAQEKFPGWVREDPVRASEFLEHTGVVMLLLPSLYAEVSRLSDGRIDRASKGSRRLDPETFELLSALSEVLDKARKSDSGWGDGTGSFGGMGLGGGDFGGGCGGGGDAGSC